MLAGPGIPYEDRFSLPATLPSKHAQALSGVSERERRPVRKTDTGLFVVDRLEKTDEVSPSVFV
jgi:hypothetical protein